MDDPTEEIPKQQYLDEISYATSGVMSASELENWNRNLKDVYAGTHQPEKVVGWYGWGSWPSDYNMLHRVEHMALAEKVHIEFSNVKTSGWFLKVTTFTFKVEGLESKVLKFRDRVLELNNQMLRR